MKRGVASRIKEIGAHDDTIFSKCVLFSRHSLLEENKQVMKWGSRQASSVVSLPGRCIMLNALCNTPPQVDKSTCRDIERNETGDFEEKTRQLFPLVALSRLLYFSAAKKPIQLPSQDLIADGDPKEKEKQPKPDKLKPQQPKPDKKSDKGSRRVKRPRV